MPPVTDTRRFTRRAAILLGLHALAFAAVLAIAFFIRYDFELDRSWLETYSRTVLAVVAIKVAVFYWLGQCHAPWRRASFRDLSSLVSAATLASLVFMSCEGLFLTSDYVGLPRVPRSVVVLDWAGTVLVIGGIRALWRAYCDDVRPYLSGKPMRTVLIVGANHEGELLAQNLAAASRNQYFVVGFLDDDPSLLHHRVAGVPVLGGVELAGEFVRRKRVDDVMVRSGSLAGGRFRPLMKACVEAGADVRVIPAIDELLSTHDSPLHLQPRPVEIKDLLRREPVTLDDVAVRALVEGRTVMVTGAGGSIGSEICRQVLRYRPRKVLLVERGENQLFIVEQEFARYVPRPPVEAILADIADEPRMDLVMRAHRPDVVFHAAAHKHVPMMELHPAEAVKNNCVGTQSLARLADRHGVGTFVMISTDKAVNPTSVMGCSKLIAERYVQALNGESGTKFVVVRFGNVLASNGSVVPIFQEQIRQGGPITITHPGIARYFMMIPEASQLVLQAAAMGSGGEIFVLDMGESVKIVDLAKDLISLSGLAEDDIEIVYTGLRPGEKLYEELYFDDERRVATNHPKVFCALHRPTTLADSESVIDELVDMLDESPDAVRGRMRELVPEYGGQRAGDEMPASFRKTHAK
jgi:FlaA1/EpsC-like NDP-sugar epimerase